MQGFDVVTLVLRWIHIVAAMAAIGGAIFMYVAYVPASETLEESTRQSLREETRKRWAKFIHGAIGLLLITGGINFVRLAVLSKINPMPYHAIFGVKFLLALVVFFLATGLVGRSPAFAKVRQNPRSWLAGVVVLGIVIVLLSGVLNQVRVNGVKTAPPVAADKPAG